MNPKKKPAPKSHKNQSWLITTGYAVWVLGLIFTLSSALNGDLKPGWEGFIYYLYPAAVGFFSLMGGTSVSIFASSLFILNIGLLGLAATAAVHLFLKSKIWGSVLIIFTILLPAVGNIPGYNSALSDLKPKTPSLEYCIKNKDDSCMLNVARDTKNIDLCTVEFMDRYWQLQCFKEFIDMDPVQYCSSLCGAVSKEEQKELFCNGCYRDVARISGDPALCEKIPHTHVFFGYCLTELATDKKDMDLCNRLRELAPDSNEYYTCVKKVNE